MPEVDNGQFCDPKLTAKEAREYKQSKQSECPFCKSSMILGLEVLVEDGLAKQTMMCEKCGSGWTDLYKFIKCV